jgi:hypothetical protein
MAIAQAWLCLLALRSLQPGAALRPAWLLITLSAFSRVIGGLASQALSAAWLLNPTKPTRSFGMEGMAAVLTGPVQLALLAAGLLAGILVLREFGLCTRPKAAGWILTGILVLFNLYRFGAEIKTENLLLCVLSVEAAFLWQSAASMGGGLVARCWRAFAVGTFVIGLGQVALWAAARYLHGWLALSLEWYVWFPGMAFLALAPAHMVSAVRRATGRVAERARPSMPAFSRTAAAN